MTILLFIRKLLKLNFYENPGTPKNDLEFVAVNLKDLEDFNIGVIDTYITSVNRTTGKITISRS